MDPLVGGPSGRPLAAVLAVGLIAAFAGACSPTCGQACARLFDECGLEYPDGYDEQACVDSCQYQRDRYLRIYDEDLLEPHLQCVLDTSCEELTADAPCFDEDVYIIPG